MIYYDKTREARAEVTEALKKFRYGDVKVPDSVMENSGRELNARFQEKLLGKIMLRCMGKLLVPFPVRASWTGIRALGYLGRGINSLRRKAPGCGSTGRYGHRYFPAEEKHGNRGLHHVSAEYR